MPDRLDPTTQSDDDYNAGSDGIVVSSDSLPDGNQLAWYECTGWPKGWRGEPQEDEVASGTQKDPDGRWNAKVRAISNTICCSAH